MGATFVALPSNCLGCLIIGMICSSAQMKLSLAALAGNVKLDVLALPVTHRLQFFSFLWLGLRVGFCGSLTTFSAWIIQIVVMLAAGKVAAAIFALLIGLGTPLAALLVGMSIAADMRQRNAPPEDILAFAPTPEHTPASDTDLFVQVL